MSVRHAPVAALFCLLWLAICASPAAPGKNKNTTAATGTCHCWWGYVEHRKPDQHCRNSMTDHVLPCNFPKTPTCKCTGAVSNILKDRTGTWCTRYSKGEELMRWPCENREDWVKFFEMYPELLV